MKKVLTNNIKDTIIFTTNARVERGADMKLDFSPLILGEKTEIPFSFEFDASSLAEDIAECRASVSGKAVNHAGYMEILAKTVLNMKVYCSRCSKPMEKALKFDSAFSVCESLAGENTDEYVILEDRKADLESLIYESALLELPSKHLCSEDCKGLCPKCGKDLNEGSCGCSTVEIDPRLAKLQDLFKDKK